jgi:hypothetical protein
VGIVHFPDFDMPALPSGMGGAIPLGWAKVTESGATSKTRVPEKSRETATLAVTLETPFGSRRSTQLVVGLHELSELDDAVVMSPFILGPVKVCHDTRWKMKAVLDFLVLAASVIAAAQPGHPPLVALLIATANAEFDEKFNGILRLISYIVFVVSSSSCSLVLKSLHAS